MMHAHRADQEAARRMVAVEPEWRGIERAGVTLGLQGRVLLHAGPPLRKLDTLVRPVMNSAVMAVLFEGWAPTPAVAERLITSSQVRLEPAQDHYAVVPLAEVLSPSMYVQVVQDRVQVGRTVCSPLNGGNGPATRLGLCNDAVLAHLHWIDEELAPVLMRALDVPVPLIPLADHGLAHGDDCHGRTPAASQALAALLAPRLGGDAAARASRTFLENSPGFFLNLCMAASKCMMRAAEGSADASVVTAIGGNGVEFGVQLAGAPGRWLTVPATAPLVARATAHVAERSLSAIGDSAVVEAVGLGAMALAYAPETAQALAPLLAADAALVSEQLLAAGHPGFSLTRPRTALSARAVVESALAPMISLGVLDKLGIEGRLGGGLYRPPVALFEKACREMGIPE